ncbi:MAG: MaoC family dehydratase [Actinobacteria bacterium]|nr:MaoC family dehydratase [Actinomycetota bacterium]MCB9390075.1 MaoC family dehydratase [Acidimicrobiia bacterium]
MNATTKTNPGRFFEDFRVGETLTHATPRTLTEGDRALYMSLYPTRFALGSSSAFAAACGLDRYPLEDLIGFHVAFGKTVPDVSLNAVANLGYADCRFLSPVYPGDTITTESTVIGLKENSNGKTGIVYVRSDAADANGRPVLTWARWVMVRKNDIDAPAPDAVIPDLPSVVAPEELPVPEGLNFAAYDTTLSGERYTLGDYEIGERINHVDGVTITDAEHMMATRLWQNTAKVHFNVQARPDGKRLIYGGHIISLARALSFNGLANAPLIAAINGGSHTAPCFAGDTVYAWSEVLDTADMGNGIGAIRLRLVAVKDAEPVDFPLRGDDGKYADGVLLDLDYWALMPA